MLIVVIGVALLAFIVGDALTNSRNLFGDNTTVAKIGGKKIDYTEYQRKREELNRQLEQLKQTNPQQYANFDAPDARTDGCGAARGRTPPRRRCG